jgi:hypothetical protein
MQADLAAAAGGLLQMDSIAICATLDQFLQHLDETLITYVQNN